MKRQNVASGERLAEHSARPGPPAQRSESLGSSIQEMLVEIGADVVIPGK